MINRTVELRKELSFMHKDMEVKLTLLPNETVVRFQDPRCDEAFGDWFELEGNKLLEIWLEANEWIYG